MTEVSRKRGLARAWRDESGATALEFAMLLPPFLILLMAILQLGLVYFTNSRMERSVFVAKSSLARTASRPKDIAAVKTLICNQTSVIDCQREGFFVEVVPLTATSPTSTGPTADAFAMTPGQTHIIRVAYPWRSILPANLLEYIGLGGLAVRVVRVGMFFHADS